MTVYLVSIAAVLAAGLGAVVGILRRRLAVVLVHGVSMAPTYVPGDLVLIRRVPARRIRTGDVVVIGPPPAAGWPAGPLPAAEVPPNAPVPPADRRWLRPRWVMKRVVALPGDPVPEVVAAAVVNRGPAAGSSRVPADHLVVLGDNREHSIDSRTWGYLPAERLLGVVTRRLRVRGMPMAQ